MKDYKDIKEGDKLILRVKSYGGVELIENVVIDGEHVLEVTVSRKITTKVIYE